MGYEVDFNPAQTLSEARHRLFALTGVVDPGTRGPKRALESLARSLNLDVDLTRVNAELGGDIARALGAPWSEGRHFDGLQVTLSGLNVLLAAAAANFEQLSKARTIGHERAADVIRTFSWFRPARNKQEAVNRLSDLCGVERDTLGPGGKEHMVTFVSVARRYAPHLAEGIRTKQRLAEALCEHFGVPWISMAASTGDTITLDGLNLVLAGLERYVSMASNAWATPAEEATALVDHLVATVAPYWDGRDCIEEMRAEGSSQWRQMEWPGFYFEEKARSLLNQRFPTPAVGGPQVRFGNTVFDFATATRVWDIKVHTAAVADPVRDGATVKTKSDEMWLNDAVAMRTCIEQQGLGFLAVEGVAELDVDGSFTAWHKQLGTTAGKTIKPYVASTGRRRPRKAAFTPTALHALWINDLNDLSAAVAAGWIQVSTQPDWAGVLSRNDKFKAKLHRAGAWRVAYGEWDEA